MGLYVKGVLGSFSGKVGTVVGANWRSIDYLRSLPKPSSKPATEKQIAHRAKFALVINFLSPLRELINIGYNDGQLAKQTGFNKATGQMMRLVEGEYPNFNIPYDQVVLSNGGMQPVRAVVGGGMDGMEISWNTASNLYGANPTDVVNLVLYSEETDDFFVFQDATRADGLYSITSEEMGGGRFHSWIFATSANDAGRSKSTYLGEIEF